MAQTGTSIPILLSLLAIPLPLIPIIIIFIRRTWQLDTMIFLGVICLLSLLQHIMIYLPKLATGNTTVIKSIFGLGEFGLLLYLYRLVIKPAWAGELLYTVLIAYVSVAITLYALGGIVKYATPLAMAAAVVILLVSMVVLVQLIRHKQLFIFQSPMFWIAGGNLSYSSIYGLTGFLFAQEQATPSLQQERLVLLSVLHLIRFAFFIVAAYTMWPEKKTSRTTYNTPWL